jgi:DNA-binding MarR family transcriptional regulator
MSTDATSRKGEGVPTGPSLNPQIIGQTEKALRALLERTLAGAGLAYRHWVVLSVIAGSEAPADENELAVRVEGVLKVDDATAPGVIADLHAREVVEPTPDDRSHIRLTDAGHVLHRDVRAAIGPIVNGLFHEIPNDDLRTAGKVLKLITERADKVLAGS